VKTADVVSVNKNRLDKPITKLSVVVSSKFNNVVRKVELLNCYLIDVIALVKSASDPLIRFDIGL
jgi:hypothetical protein